jgi:hypothetical protein
LRLIEGVRQREPDSAGAVAGQLSEEEALGLEAYLHFLRRGYESRSTTIDYVTVGYYRKGAKIGEEQFRDGSGLVSGIHQEHGRVIVPMDQAPRDFSPELFQAIVPPWLIAQRLEMPNKALEPTPTSVTDRAAHAPRQP